MFVYKIKKVDCRSLFEIHELRLDDYEIKYDPNCRSLFEILVALVSTTSCSVVPLPFSF